MLTREARPVTWRMLAPLANASAPDDGNDAERARLERKHGRAIAAAFVAVRKKVAPARATKAMMAPEAAVARLRSSFGVVGAAIRAMLTDAALLGAAYGFKYTTGELTANVDAATMSAQWDLVNMQAIAWVMGGSAEFGDGYANELIGDILRTSETQLRSAIVEWTANGEPLPALVDRLERTALSRSRAELIAVTEVTRAYAAGARQAWQAGGIIKTMRWQTANDELVCPICQPLNQSVARVDGGRFDAYDTNGNLVASAPLPPAHPRCRCWVSPVAQSIDSLRDEAAKADAERAARRAEAERKRAEEEAAKAVALQPGMSFPSDLDSLVVVRRLGGSTGAQLVEDPATGLRYVRKAGASAEHLRAEYLADELYRAMGANVPRAQLYETAAGPVKLAEFIDGRTLGELRQLDKRAYRAALRDTRKFFTRDAYLGNWDVIGEGFDNVLVDASGTAWRIDNGGSLMFRAQGQLKRGWGTYVDEFWTLRNPAVNRQTAEAFADVTYDDIVRGMRGILRKRSDVEALLAANGDDALTRQMLARLDSMQDYLNIHKTLTGDQWVTEYVDDFTRHVAGLRNSGVVGRFPEKMVHAPGFPDTVMQDANGIRWDNLRTHTVNRGAHNFDDVMTVLTDKNGMLSPSSVDTLEQMSEYNYSVDWQALRRRAEAGNLSRNEFVRIIDEKVGIDAVASKATAPSNPAWFRKYLNDAGGNYDAVVDWQEGQRGSSWSSQAQAGKWFYTKQRTMDARQAFYWQDGIESAEAYYNTFAAKYGKQVVDETFTAMHAWNYEYLRNVKMPYTDLKRGVIRVVRTESRDVLTTYNGLQIGDTGQVIRGAVESTSLFDGVVVKGPELTIQDVPLHRAVGNYLFEGTIGSRRTSLYGDGENELVVMLDGLRVHYAGNTYALNAAEKVADGRLVHEKWFSKFKIPK